MKGMCWEDVWRNKRKKVGMGVIKVHYRPYDSLRKIFKKRNWSLIYTEILHGTEVGVAGIVKHDKSSHKFILLAPWVRCDICWSP